MEGSFFEYALEDSDMTVQKLMSFNPVQKDLSIGLNGIGI